jgi:hypothetical protein
MKLTKSVHEKSSPGTGYENLAAKTIKEYVDKRFATKKKSKG